MRINRYDLGRGELQIRESGDPRIDHGGIHIRFAPRDDFGADMQLDDEIRRRASRQRVDGCFETFQPCRRIGQSMQQWAVVETELFVLWIAIRDDDEAAPSRPLPVTGTSMPAAAPPSPALKPGAPPPAPVLS